MRVLAWQTASLRFLGELDWTNWLIPSSCLLGRGMIRLLLVRALLPLAMIIILPIAGSTFSAVRHALLARTLPSVPEGTNKRKRSWQSGLASYKPYSIRDAFVLSLLKWLPLSLIATFCFTPSVSASLFRAWHCVSFAYNELEEFSYLAQDLSVRCNGNSAEYTKILAVAWPLVVLWPVGMVVLYAALLLPCRQLLISAETRNRWSPLLRGTAFLHRDYKPCLRWESNCSLCTGFWLTSICTPLWLTSICIPLFAANTFGGRS